MGAAMEAERKVEGFDKGANSLPGALKLVLLTSYFIYLLCFQRYGVRYFLLCPVAPGATTRLALVAHEIFWLSKSTSWPSSIQESKTLR